MLIIEIVSEDRMAISFKNFFSDAIKEGVKSLYNARYDYRNKLWTAPMDQKADLIRKVEPLCDLQGIQVFDVPKFVLDFLSVEIPFSGPENGF